MSVDRAAALWLALALLGSGAIVSACDAESPVADSAEDIVDKTN